MCSIFNAINQLKVNSQSLTLSSKNDLSEWCYALDFFARLLAYIAVLAVMVLVILLVLKYVTEYGEESSGEEENVRAAAASRSTSTSRSRSRSSGASESESMALWSEKRKPPTYGTCEEEEGGDVEDIETGSCSSGEDLYDGRICVICYDEQRNCFFVPCGHCATCYYCAQRNYDGENKACPVCRRVIGKVRKLFAP